MNKKIYTLDDDIGFVQLIQHVGDDTSIINSARVSFGKRIDEIQEKDIKLLKYLLDNEHLSPFEHNSITFLIKAPLFVVQQHLRHRISSFNQISARYVEIKEEFYIPSKFRKQSENNRQASVPTEELNNEYLRTTYQIGLKNAYNTYQALLKEGVCREQARGVLPHCTYSEYYWTCNLRSLLHFLKLRDTEHAQWEIRQYAQAMRELITDIFPHTLQKIELLKRG